MDTQIENKSNSWAYITMFDMDSALYLHISSLEISLSCCRLQLSSYQTESNTDNRLLITSHQIFHVKKLFCLLKQIRWEYKIGFCAVNKYQSTRNPITEQQLSAEACAVCRSVCRLCATVCQQVLVIMTYLHSLFWLLTKEPELGHEWRVEGGGRVGVAERFTGPELDRDPRTCQGFYIFIESEVSLTC